MSVPSGEPPTYAPLVLELLSLYPDEAATFTFTEKHFRAGHVAHGWLMRCIRSAEAVLLLRDEGYSVEAAPLRRSILEHASGLARVADVGGVAADSLVRRNANDVESQLKAVMDADWDIPEEPFREIIDDAATSAKVATEQDTFWAYWSRATKYGSKHDFPVYIAESGQSHPTWASAAVYVEQEDDGRVALLDYPRIGPLDEDGALFVPLVNAFVAMNYMLEGHPLTARLRSIIHRGRGVHAAILASQGKPRPPEHDEPILPDLP